MTKLNELINLINDDELIKRYKELERIIDHNEAINQTFKELLDIQKRLVKSEQTKNNETEMIRKEYQNKYEELTSNYIMNEYLDLLELINNDLQLITTIIEEEINLDFID